MSVTDFHGAYFSNYDIWLKDAKDYFPCLSILSLIHQDILNILEMIPYYFEGIDVLSGIFQLWACSGIVACNHLKCFGTPSLGAGHASLLLASYFHMHYPSITDGLKILFYNHLPFCLTRRDGWRHLHHLSLAFGLTVIALSGHQYHISVPPNPLLHSATSPLYILSPEDLFFKDLIELISMLGQPVNNSCSHEGVSPATHHFYVGIVFITSSVIVSLYARRIDYSMLGHKAPRHGEVGATSLYSGSLSTTLANVENAIPIYPFSLSDYATGLSLFYHHMWVGSLLMIGSPVHASIFLSASYLKSNLLKHRDVIISHLIWVTVALGLHSFGLYIHNDRLQALSHPQDIFDDNSIQLIPVFILYFTICKGDEPQAPFDIKILDKKLIADQTPTLGTADFIVLHVQTFTIHLPLLILSKGILYARNSRLLPDKWDSGFRYPCDGPGRGGTCQISPSDHIYLALFWMYNSLGALLFHYFWKMQSDVWALIYYIPSEQITHISGGDFSVNVTTINAFLRNFLWSEAAQVIQSYTPPISPYGFIFISAHFIWAFSLMFLYSGRGYWQEFIESILWGHHKLKIMVDIQPRALDISQGRAVGFIHYTLGGVGCTWAFFISRMVVLSI